MSSPDITCACGGEIIYRSETIDGVRDEAWICERCTCGITWRRRIGRTRPRLDQVSDLDKRLCDASCHADGARHSLLLAARACEDLSLLARVEALQSELAAVTMRIAALLRP